MIFDRLAIGTANWGKEYNGAKVSEDDQKRILDYCREVGIDMIDTATAYGWDWTKIDPYFKVVVKTDKTDEKTIKSLWESNPYCIMAHNVDVWDNWGKGYWDYRKSCYMGISVYNTEELRPWLGNFVTGFKILQIPYSLYDRRAEEGMYFWKNWKCKIHVRSIFLRGKILKEYSPQDCIMFCLMNPYVDRVILGAESFKQFKDNLAFFEDLCKAQKDDIELLDPRKWKDEKCTKTA